MMPRSYNRQLVFLILGSILPGTALGLVLLWTGDFTLRLQWTITLGVMGVAASFGLALHGKITRPLQTLSNLLGGFREGDFSIRARGADPLDPLGLVHHEVNTLGDTLRGHRLGVLEATALLNRVMREIDVAVFAFDEFGRLQLLNRAGARLLAAPEEELLGRKATDLGLHEYLSGPSPRTFDGSFPGRWARWEVRRGAFRQAGQPHTLIVLSDLTRALREEERQAWRRLVRVLSHEINNSLAPIHSIAGTLAKLVDRETLPPDWRDDTLQGLRVVEERAEGLRRFMAGYARLARLPNPEMETVDVSRWVNHVAQLEQRLAVEVQPGPKVEIQGDAHQLEQLLINVVRNAVDAALETGGGVQLSWSSSKRDGGVQVKVIDEGNGLADRSNLFVPFFSTKAQGSGVGLLLIRQIAEAHGGTFTLENRRDRPGCVALLSLPRVPPP
ncbi:MAG: ATP-binding protein [Gemmatimonadota bacterium]